MSANLYTTNEAAEQLGVTPARVRQMVARGEIESEKLGRDRFITAEAIAKARQRKTAPGPIPRANAIESRATIQKNTSNGTSTGKKKASKR